MHHVDPFYDAILEVQPTVFFGTPDVYESLYYRLKDLRRTMSGLQRMFLNWDERERGPCGTFPPIRQIVWRDTMTQSQLMPAPEIMLLCVP